MKLIIELLKQKNNYLSQFKKINAFECHRLQSGDYSHIEQFYYSRQIILDAIDNIDTSLKEYRADRKASEEDKQTIRDLLNEKRKITFHILRQDMVIHSYINGLQYDVLESQTA